MTIPLSQPFAFRNPFLLFALHVSLQTLLKDIHAQKLNNNCDLATDSPPYSYLTVLHKHQGLATLPYTQPSRSCHTVHSTRVLRFTQMTAREVTAAVFKQDKIQEITTIRGLRSGNRVDKLSGF